MRQEKILAINLRKKGKSYKEISDLLKISKSTLSFWLAKIKLSPAARKKIWARGKRKSIEALIKRNKNQTVLANIRAYKNRQEYSQKIGKLTDREILLIGSALYWGEGYKKGAEGSQWKCVDLTNSDPEMIKMMMVFFRKICKVDEKDFRIQLALHNNKNQNNSLNFWEKITGIPRSQFLKISIIKSKASQGKQKKYLKHGTIHLRIYNVNLFHKIIGYIDGLKSGV